MLYASAGLLALIINLIINHDVLIVRNPAREDRASRIYRNFLIAVNAFYVTDILWGLLYERKLLTLTFLDTVGYFLTMGCSILFWTFYVVTYLEERKLFARILLGIGRLIFLVQVLALVLNFFFPVLFSFDSAGVYHAEFLRYVTLILQIAMFTLTAVYALRVTAESQGTKRIRHFTIGLSSVVMGVFAAVQSLYPLLPLYALGCMFSTCVTHSFVLENEEMEYRDTLEQRLQDSILKGNYYDLLTGMPGMSYFFELAGKQREAMVKAGGKPTFLFFDLSGMKFFNQKHGFSEGDRILREFSHLLIQFFGEDHCSRFGSDQFAVFTEETGLEETLKKIFESWKATGEEDLPAIRVGIYLDDGKNADISTACDRAKAARDSIRRTYVSEYCYFDEEMLRKAEHSKYIISHLNRAIEEGWIEVYYQPIIRAVTGKVCDEEALARWKDPDRGFLSPADFIPVLEDAGLIYKLDLHVLDLLLEKMKTTREYGLHLVPQSINLSRSDFEACDMVKEISTRMDRAGMPHHLLSIEITESILGTNSEFMRSEIERFRALGFPVWLDDFGSGYSSLDVLADMPIDLIKLDMRFMETFDRGEKSRIILTELMKMANGLGIDTVCEGVERADQMEFLRDIGCAKLQGYYYLRPTPLSGILERYEKGIQIGFENPEESDYYDAVGRINLYDAGILTHDDASFLHRFFRTIPMGILELQGRKIRVLRSNKAYREFARRTFGMELTERAEPFADTPELESERFIQALTEIARDGGRTFFDETLADGTAVHSFFRRVSSDPVTGTTAIIIAVLSVVPADSDKPMQIQN